QPVRAHRLHDDLIADESDARLRGVLQETRGHELILSARAEVEDQHRGDRREDVDRGGLVETERSATPDRDVGDRRDVAREQKGVHWSPEGRAGFKPGAASVRLTYFISQTRRPRCVPTMTKPSVGRSIQGW